MKILLVEDDKDLNETITEYLSNYYDVYSVFSGDKALDIIYENNFDLYILDIKLPKVNGFEIAKYIREKSNAPIIFLTSLDTEDDVEKGFNSGADDYIKKPFSLKELKLRVDAILNRVYGKSQKVNIGDNFVFDFNNNELYKDNKLVNLKPKEALLLSFFLQNRGRVLSKEEIYNYLYKWDEEPNEQSLRVFVNRLRNILGKDSILTVKNIGYKFVK